MNDYLNRAGKTILIVIITVCALSIAVSLSEKTKGLQVVYIQDPNYVQSPYEAQQILKDMGLYHGKIDGIWGKESDRAYCDYCAVNEIEGKQNDQGRTLQTNKASR